MTEEEARTVQQRVEDYLKSEKAQGFDIGNSQHFDRLVDSVRTPLPHVAKDDLRTVTAMCLLGPGSVTGRADTLTLQLHGATSHPPAAMREELLGILRRLVPDQQERLERVMEFAIAYGCGKWRGAREGNGGWEQQWEGAVRGLIRALEPAVNESSRWLARHVVGFPKDKDVAPDASMLAIRLRRPEHPLHLERV